MGRTSALLHDPPVTTITDHNANHDNNFDTNPNNHSLTNAGKPPWRTPGRTSTILHAPLAITT